MEKIHLAETGPQFIGREESLEWLQRKIMGWGDAQQYSTILLIHGPEGAGKSRLIEHFINTQTGKDGHLKTANFFWRGPLRPSSVGHFAQILMQSGSTHIPDLENRRALLNLNINAPPVSLEEMRGDVPSDTYNMAGKPNDKGTVPVTIDSKQNEGLADSCVKAFSDWFEDGNLLPRLKLETLFRLIFIFDSFETYPTSIKDWIGRYFFPALERHPSVPQLSVLLSGRQSFEQGGQADYWQAHPGAFHQYSLGAMSRHDCEQWLAALGMRLSLVDVLFEETEGIPSRIIQAVKDKEWLEKKSREKGDPLDPLSFFNAQERRWLHAVGMNKAVSLETLQVLLGRVEGTLAFGWLSRHIEFCQVEETYSGEHLISLSEEMRENVLRRVTSQVPTRHQEFLDKLGLMASVRAKVSAFDHRTHLRRLTPVQPFSKDLIKEVFNGE